MIEVSEEAKDKSVEQDKKIKVLAYNTSLCYQARSLGLGNTMISVSERVFRVKDIIEAMKEYRLTEVLRNGRSFYTTGKELRLVPQLFIPVVSIEDGMTWFINYADAYQALCGLNLIDDMEDEDEE